MFVIGKLPQETHKQGNFPDKTQRNQILEKLDKVKNQRCVTPGDVQNLTNYFGVAKVDDIQKACDVTKLGLNAMVWAPTFCVPSVDTMHAMLTSESWIGDLDFGEFFLKFVSHQDLRPFVGVDLTPLCPERKHDIYERWGRMMMVFCHLLHIAAQSLGWVDEIIKGNPADLNFLFNGQRCA